MYIDDFSEMHSIQPEAPKSWIQEKMYTSQHPESESNDIFLASEFVELDIPITTEETTLFKILQRLALLHMMFDFSNARIFLRPGTTEMT